MNTVRHLMTQRRGAGTATATLCLMLWLGLTATRAEGQQAESAADMQRVAAGFSSSLAVRPDGSLWAWGAGPSGDGTGLPRIRPVQIMTGVKAAAAGFFHRLALKTDGTLWAWGWGPDGQLGDGTTGSRATPVRVLTGVAAIAAGQAHSLALKTDGTLWAWGSNFAGALGDGTTTNRTSPVQVLTGIKAVTARGYQSLAVGIDGNLWTWGFGHSEIPTPFAALSDVAAVAAGGHHVLALTADGILWAWGLNTEGQIGDGTTDSVWDPVAVLDEVAAIAAGDGHSLAIRTDGSLWAWGQNDNGQIGDGTTENAVSPIQVMSGVAAAAGGDSHTLALKDDGTVWSWGANGDGRLGDGTTTDRPTPGQVIFAPPGPDFVVNRIGLTLTRGGSPPRLTLSAAVTIQNQGTRAGSAGVLQVWVNQPVEQRCGAAADRSIRLPIIGTDATTTVNLTSLPIGPPGVKTLRVFIDGRCQTAEVDESNNQSTQSYTVPVPGPDFVVAGLTLTPASPIAGATFDATVTLFNAGMTAGVPGTLQVWTDEPTPQECNAAGDASVTLPTTMAPGTSRTVTVRGLSAGAVGSKTLRAFVDSTCRVNEMEESNNQFALPYRVADPGPDLVITTLSLAPAGPRANRTFSATVKVKNQGTLGAAPGQVQFWTDAAAPQDCGAVGDRSVLLPALAAGATRTLTVTGLSAGTAGLKWLRAFIDGACQVQERDEENNQSLRPYSVMP